jgi:large subunit ribosomal protein L30
MAKTKELKVTLLKSKFGRLKSHRACIAGLGLRRIRHTVTVLDTPENRGMINRISYLVSATQLVKVRPVDVVLRVRKRDPADFTRLASRADRCLCSVACRKSASVHAWHA